MVNKPDWNEHAMQWSKVESRTTVTEKPLYLLFKSKCLGWIFSRLKITLKNISLRKDEAYT